MSALPRRPLVILGVLSIVTFGVWFYGYGVLLEPLVRDTGWSESAVASAFGGSLLLTGVGATVGGRVLDRRGSRTLFIAAGCGSGAALLLAAATTSQAVFVVAASVGGGITGAAGYYHATQAVMARLAPAERTRGITALTLWGAFASPVALPVMGWAVTTVGWRATLRGGALTIAAAFLLAGVGIRDVHPEV